jgi:hypothetical protein
MPSDASIANFREVAFFVVDWDLNRAELAQLGAEPGAGSSILEEQNEASIVKFLQELKKVRFAPVFIFTDESVDFVESKLKKHAELYDADDPSHILVIEKAKVIESGVFVVLTEWMKKAPSVYVLKSWEKAYEKAKNQLFLDFYMKSTLWPLVVWKNFKDDSGPPRALMGELIGRNLVSRMTPLDCDLDAFDDQLKGIEKDAHAYQTIVRKVLEGERFLLNSLLDSESMAPGDIFTTDGGYLINIRPDCDCIARGHDTLAGLELYLLKGTEKSPADLGYVPGNGDIHEQDNEATVFPVYDGKALCFKFKKLQMKKWREVKGNRIGRLLPPYLTRLQQRYSAYLQRPGLPRLPSEAFPSVPLYVEGITAVAPAAAIPSTPPPSADVELKPTETSLPEAPAVVIPANQEPSKIGIDEAAPVLPDKQSN